jgi:tetratricopeptide (TPR) repeat protein
LLPGIGYAEAVVGDVELNSLSGAYLAARTADQEKDMSGAAALYSAAVKMDPENLFLLERALVTSAASGELDQAVGYARDLLARAPTSHAARLIIAVDQMRGGKHAEAIEMLSDPGAGVLADLTSALLIAWARFGQGEVDRALEDLTALEGEDWYEPFKLLHSGYLSLASGRTGEAIRLLEKARELDPNAVRITEAYARALVAANRKPEAEAALDDFISRFPDNPLALATREELRGGSASPNGVSTPVQGAAEALAGLGAAVGQEGGSDVASLYLRLALHLEPQAAGGLAALSLGNLLDSNEQGEAAIEVFESIAPDAPFRPLGVLRSALALDRMDRTEDAERAFKEVLQRSPDDIQAYISYANMLRGRERFADAANIYSEAIVGSARPPSRIGASSIFVASLTSAPRNGTRPKRTSGRRWSSSRTSRWS